MQLEIVGDIPLHSHMATLQRHLRATPSHRTVQEDALGQLEESDAGGSTRLTYISMAWRM